jgi:hypothetical protein
VKEYLVSTEFFSRFGGNGLFQDVLQAYVFVAKASLAYLLSLQDDLNEKLLESRPLLRHAVACWMVHFENSGEDASLDRLATRLAADNGQTRPWWNVARLCDDPIASLDRPAYELPPRLISPSLSIASSQGCVSLVRALLKAGSDPNAASNYRLPLQAAAAEGCVSIVRALLKAGADPNARGLFGSTPLLEASGRGHSGVIKLLLEHGANPTARARRCEPIYTFEVTYACFSSKTWDYSAPMNREQVLAGLHFHLPYIDELWR